jgi:3-deoxy-D-manno-octulosonic-acid transferase
MELITEVGDRVKFIIAPHEVGPERVKDLRSGTRNPEPGTILFSELNEENAPQSRVLIVDGIGYLSHLYQYATIAYIGGGFGVGIHNILEAATFGKPVIFGPNYRKFREAVELIEAGGAFSITDSQQLNNRTIELLNNPVLLQKSSSISASFVQKKKGATEIILSSIK